MRAMRWGWAYGAIVLWCACAPTRPASLPTASPQPATSWDYELALEPTLTTLTAKLCFEGAPPPRLVCGPGADPGAVPAAQRLRDGQTSDLPTAACHIDLSGLRADDCVRYTVSLRGPSRPFPIALVPHTDTRITAATGTFLYRPARRTAQLHGRARFVVPDGVQVSVPWQRADAGFALDASAFEHVGYVAFGAFEHQHFVVDDVPFDLAVLAPLSAELHAALPTWITSVAQAGSQIGGAFPTDHAQILLWPRPGTGGIDFGMVGRGGGASVFFLLRDESSVAELLESWEPGHELTHLRTPLLQLSDRWLSEGIATYYQEVVRARAGVTTAADAWKRLHTGMSRGIEVGTGRTLRQESAQMYQTGAFQRVYWAGAALALMADVELRVATEGRLTLDAVLLGINSQCEARSRAWTSDELMTCLDRVAARQWFTTLAAHWLDRSEFPDFASVFERLGITVGNAGAQLDQAHALAVIRDAIMAPVPPTTARHTSPRLTAAQ